MKKNKDIQVFLLTITPDRVVLEYISFDLWNRTVESHRKKDRSFQPNITPQKYGSYPRYKQDRNACVLRQPGPDTTFLQPLPLYIPKGEWPMHPWVSRWHRKLKRQEKIWEHSSLGLTGFSCNSFREIRITTCFLMHRKKFIIFVSEKLSGFDHVCQTQGTWLGLCIRVCPPPPCPHILTCEWKTYGTLQEIK